MIKLRQLINRVYDGTNCIRFEYEVIQHGGNKQSSCFVARYWKDMLIPCSWNMQVVIPGNSDCDSQVYTISYATPKDNIKLELIAALGLRQFQLRLKEEIQKKSEWDFALGEVLHDMYGGD